MEYLIFDKQTNEMVDIIFIEDPDTFLKKHKNVYIKKADKNFLENETIIDEEW
jgi:hypothetical protein